MEILNITNLMYSQNRAIASLRDSKDPWFIAPKKVDVSDDDKIQSPKDMLAAFNLKKFVIDSHIHCDNAALLMRADAEVRSETYRHLNFHNSDPETDDLYHYQALLKKNTKALQFTIEAAFERSADDVLVDRMMQYFNSNMFDLSNEILASAFSENAYSVDAEVVGNIRYENRSFYLDVHTSHIKLTDNDSRKLEELPGNLITTFVFDSFAGFRLSEARVSNSIIKRLCIGDENGIELKTSDFEKAQREEVDNAKKSPVNQLGDTIKTIGKKTLTRANRTFRRNSYERVENEDDTTECAANSLYIDDEVFKRPLNREKLSDDYKQILVQMKASEQAQNKKFLNALHSLRLTVDPEINRARDLIVVKQPKLCDEVMLVCDHLESINNNPSYSHVSKEFLTLVLDKTKKLTIDIKSLNEVRDLKSEDIKEWLDEYELSDIDGYLRMAQQLAVASAWGKIVAGAMLVIAGIFVAALSAVIAVASLGLSAPVTIAGATFAASTTMAGYSIASTALGICGIFVGGAAVYKAYAGKDPAHEEVQETALRNFKLDVAKTVNADLDSIEDIVSRGSNLV